MKTKVEAQYKPASNPQKRCALCSMFLKGGYCTLVEGRIHPSYTCKWWEKKGKDG